MIRHQSNPPRDQERSDPWFSGADGIIMGTAILRTALEFDRLAGIGKPRHEALTQMRQSGLFHSRLLIPMIEKLRAFARTVGMPQPLSVLVPHSTLLVHA